MAVLEVGGRSMEWTFWQAPDRDSPKTAEFTANVELGRQLDLLLRTALAGKSGTKEDYVREATGEELSRPRRWHKIFERMGLLFPGEDGRTHITELGKVLVEAETRAKVGMRQSLARAAVAVLRKYQLKNPADETEEGSYPDDCDIHPYWAIWKAVVELDGKLHWDELNREIFRVLRHADLDEAIRRIRSARLQPDYDPVSGRYLRDRCYDQATAPEGRDPSDQIRDQKTTPWFRRAGFGGLLLQEPGRERAGYWTIPADIRSILAEATRTSPQYRPFSNRADWFEYFSKLDPEEFLPTISAQIGDTPAARVERLLQQRHNVILYGPPGTGKTVTALTVARAWQIANGDGSVTKVTFHPSYGYEDFVHGYRPLPDRPGEFRITDGSLLIACAAAEKLAAESPPRKALLFIDEINRGDVARIFGELITYIEPDKREIGFVLAQRPGAEYQIPKNLYFLGTMNTADKSISLLDVALRRRFAFVEFPPDSTAYRHIPGWRDEVSGVILSDLLEGLNERLRREGIDEDRAIGHALLGIPRDATDPVGALRARFQYDIQPLILEYCYMDRSRVQRVLGGIVNARGGFRDVSDLDFVAAVRALAQGERASSSESHSEEDMSEQGE
jgi:hypothetical protein